MTALADLITDVYSITNRPDLVSETIYCIKKATLRLHQLEQFPKDLKEVKITGLVSTSTIDNRYSIDTSLTPFVRFRALLYIRDEPLVPATVTPIDNYQEVPADIIMNGYQQEFPEYYYRVGNAINLRTSKTSGQVKIGYYSNPDVGSTGVTPSYSSWIADLYSMAVTDDAAAQIFKLIGKDEEYSRFREISADNFRLLVMSQIT